MDSITANMISKAYNALQHSYAPYSHFSVACCIRTEQDHLYTGINVENSSYGLTLCAETSAIANMVSCGEQKIKDMVVLAGSNELCSPCGACRQRIYEFSTPETTIHLCNNDSIMRSITINDLLPLAFDFNFQP